MYLWSDACQPSEATEDPLEDRKGGEGAQSEARQGNQDYHNPGYNPRKEPLSQGWLKVQDAQTYACGGMARAALYLLSELGPTTLRLRALGYRVVLVGHSLGGAVAALLSNLLLTAIREKEDGLGLGQEQQQWLQCVSYSPPACLCSALSDALRPNVLSVVLRDDVISRLTPHSIRLLMKVSKFENEVRLRLSLQNDLLYNMRRTKPISRSLYYHRTSWPSGCRGP